MATTSTVAGIALGPSGPVNGATVNAYKAQRFSSVPAQNAAAPAGVADAGPVTSGTTYGGQGAYQIACPTNESYYISTTFAGITSWTLVNDLNFIDTTDTTVAVGSNGLTLAQIVTATVLDVATTTGFAASGRIYVVTSGGQAVLSYTSVTGGATPSFNGIAVVSGTTSWTVATGNAVVSPQVITTLDQTLDDGLGNATIAGIITETGGQISKPITSGALPTVSGSFASGTGKQVLTTRDTELTVNVTNTSTAGTCAIALSPDNVTYSTIGNITSGVNGSVIAACVHVPAGWYVKFTFTNATLGTATYY